MKESAAAAGPNSAQLKRLRRPTARVPHVNKYDIHRPRHERLEVLLKGSAAAAAANPNTAKLKRLRGRQEFLGDFDGRWQEQVMMTNDDFDG